jgi:hypothetical protein
MVETSLYFGQSKPNGSMVSEKQWNQFKEDYIRKVFKEGSTVIPVSGNWYDTDKHQLITEPTYVVVYFHKPSAGLSRQIDSLRYWYKKLFDQQSVLRVDKKVRAVF